MNKNDANVVVPGGVDEYIARHGAEVQQPLRLMRQLILSCAPGAVETVSYFQIPGFSLPGFDYNGMFAWFSYVAPCVRLHVRPPVLENFGSALTGFKTTKAIVSFPLKQELPQQLILDLVRASLVEMQRAK